MAWRGSGMTNTGWTRVEIGYYDEFPASQQDGEEAVGTGEAKPTTDAAEVDASGRSTTQPTAVPAQPPNLSRTTTNTSTRSGVSTMSASREKKPLPYLRVNVLTMNVSTHLDGIKRQKGGIGSAAHDDKQKDIRSFFAGGG